MSNETNLPRKVLLMMSQLGVHPDCISAAILPKNRGKTKQAMCQQCFKDTMLSIDFFYGDLSAPERELALKRDLLADLELP